MRLFPAFYAPPAPVQIINCIRILIVATLTVVIAPAHAADAARQRVALVVGNSRYEPAIGALRNTVNDAKAVSKTLRALGFTVIEEHDVTRDELLASVVKFRAKLRGAEVGLFYFAGHGISVAGANYLLPVRSRYTPAAADDAARRLIAETKLFNVEQVVAEMSGSGVACSLVILDACRNTPVARNPALRDAAANGGLTEMNPPAGSLIAFSTDAGRTASDGEGANGVYTAELIRHLRTPGITIEQVFKRTRAGVLEHTKGAQVPAEYSRLVGDDIFLAGPAPQKEPEIKPAEEVIPKASPVAIPTIAEIRKLAARGDADKCTEALRRFARKNGPGDAAMEPLSTLLDQVKESLRDKKSAAADAAALLSKCELVTAALTDCLSFKHAAHNALTAKANSRRGDVLMLLGRNEEALAAFDTALSLAPDDAYIYCNRGGALLALGRKDEAKADFTKAAAIAPKKSGAHKLATEALAAMK